MLDEGTTSSIGEAKKLLTDDASNSVPEAQLWLVDFIAEYEPENTAEALKWLQLAAKNGSGRAAYRLARLYRESNYFPLEAIQKLIVANEQESKKWIQCSFDLGYFEAQWEFAESFFKKKDDENALKLIKVLKKLKASDFPDETEAVHQVKQLAKEMEENIEERQRHSEMLRLVEQDTSKLRPEQIYNSALLLLEKDEEKAKDLLKKAADQGLVAARKKLSELRGNAKSEK